MIGHAFHIHPVSAFFAGALLLAAAPLAAQQVSYTPSTNLQALGPYLIGQINDNPPSQIAPNSGFASASQAGDITFTFAGPTELTGFDLHNNIVVDAKGGIENFTLEFFDSSGLPLGQTAIIPAGPANQVAPTHVPLAWAGVKSVVLHVLSSHGPPGPFQRIEIREVEFQGAPASFSLDCAAVRRLGYALTTQTITRTSNAVNRGAITIPYSYSVGPLRVYGDNNVNRMFIDSFPLNPDRRRHVCQAEVAVSGSSASVNNNDGVSIFLPSNGGQIWEDHVGWRLSRGNPLRTWVLTDNLGPWTRNLTLTGQDPTMVGALGAALASTIPGGPYIDVWVHDDSVVNSVSVTYTLY
jgi:hypothetical protein